MTGQAIITRALGMTGKLLPGRTPSTAESNYGLELLNQIIDSWKTDRCYVFGLDTISVSLVSGTSEYTLSERPVHVEAASAVISAGGINSRVPVRVVTSMDELATLAGEAGSMSAFPKGIYCDYGVPDAKIWVVPTPGTGTLTLKHWNQLDTFASLATDIDLVDGVERALVTNLAVAFCAVYPQYCVLSDALKADAIAAKQGLMKLNPGHAAASDRSANGPGVAAA